MKLKRMIVASGLFTLVAAGALAVGVSPANAIPVQQGDSLTILNYYDGPKLVGQTWFGCPGVPLQKWGVVTDQMRITTAPC